MNIESPEKSGRIIIFIRGKIYYRVEPKLDCFKLLFESIDPNLRTALDMSPPAKYDHLKLKPNNGLQICRN